MAARLSSSTAARPCRRRPSRRMSNRPDVFVCEGPSSQCVAARRHVVALDLCDHRLDRGPRHPRAAGEIVVYHSTSKRGPTPTLTTGYPSPSFGNEPKCRSKSSRLIGVVPVRLRTGVVKPLFGLPNGGERRLRSGSRYHRWYHAALWIDIGSVRARFRSGLRAYSGIRSDHRQGTGCRHRERAAGPSTPTGLARAPVTGRSASREP